MRDRPPVGRKGRGTYVGYVAESTTAIAHWVLLLSTEEVFRRAEAAQIRYARVGHPANLANDPVDCGKPRAVPGSGAE